MDRYLRNGCHCGENGIFNGVAGTKYTEKIGGEIWLTFFYDVSSQGSLLADASIPENLWNTYGEAIDEILSTMEFEQED